MKAVQIFRFLFVVTALALSSCGQTVVPRWMPPPGTSYSTLHGIWRVTCRFRVVQHLHGRMAPVEFDPRGNLYLQTSLQIQQIGSTNFQFGIGAPPGSGHSEEGGQFWLALSAANGSISGSGQLVSDNPSNRQTLVSAAGTYTERALNLSFLLQMEHHEFESGYIEQVTCTATRVRDW